MRDLYWEEKISKKAKWILNLSREDSSMSEGKIDTDVVSNCRNCSCNRHKCKRMLPLHCHDEVFLARDENANQRYVTDISNVVERGL